MHSPSYLARTDQVTSTDLVRLLLIGPGGWGKTYSTMSFPNPTYVDADNNMCPEVKSRGFPVLPLWNPDWVEAAAVELNKSGPPIVAAKAAREFPLNFLIAFLHKEAKKFTADQTVVFDILTVLADMCQKQIELCHKEEIKKNSYARWSLFADWMLSFHELIKLMKCNVIVIAHEQEIRDDESGKLLGRKWLLDGKKFSNRMTSFYNNVFRQTKITEDRVKTSVGIGAPFNPNAEVETSWWWQVQADNVFEYARTTIRTQKKFVPADFKSFSTK